MPGRIPTLCPNCGTKGSIPEQYADRRVSCAACGEKWHLTEDEKRARKLNDSTSGRAQAQPTESDAFVPVIAMNQPTTKIVVHVDREEERRRPRRRRRRRWRGWECPRCGNRERPLRGSRVSLPGWIIFYLLLFTFVFCWLGLLIQEEYWECRECGCRTLPGP